MTAPRLSFAERPHKAELAVDLSVLVGSRLLIQGGSGAGKSMLARAMLEQTYGRLPHWVIDPEHEFYTLRERFDYLLVGKGGDVPAVAAQAEVLARHLAELDASVIFDLSEMKLVESREYVAALFSAMIDLPDELRRHRLAYLSEAHVFAPEGGAVRSSEAVQDVARRGRKRGWCLCADTQRISSLDKDVVGQLFNVLIGYTGLDNDIDRASKRLGFRTKDQREALPRLETGEFFAHGPALSKTAALVRGPGTTLTTHPAPGEIRPPNPAPPEAVRAMVAELSTIAGEAEEEARTLEELREQLDTWKRRAREAERGGAGAAQILEEHRRLSTLYRDLRATWLGQLNAFQNQLGAAALGAARDVGERLDQLARMLSDAVDAATRETDGIPDTPATVARKATQARNAGKLAREVLEVPRASRPAPAADVAAPEDDVVEEVSSNGRLPAPQQRMLDAIAWYNGHGDQTPSKERIGAYAGVPIKVSTFRINFGALRKLGLVEETGGGGGVALTTSGRARASTAPAPPSSSKHGRKLTRAQHAMLDAIAFYNTLGLAQPSKEQIAAYAGIPLGLSTFRIHFGRLAKLGLVEEQGGGVVLTLAGRALAATDTAPATRAELQDRWRSRLDGPKQRMFDALVAAHPQPLSRERIHALTGIDPGVSTFRIHAGALRKLGLVEDAGDGMKASDSLFPAGLR